MAPRRVIAADIETDGLGGAFLMGAMLPEGEDVTFYYDPAQMIHTFLSHKYRGWEMVFHNADYDMRYLLPTLERITDEGYQTKIICDGTGRIISCTISRSKQSWVIRDSYTLMPLPLSDLSVFANISKGDIGLRDGATFDPSNEDHKGYLTTDVQLLLRAYKRITSDLQSYFNVKPSYSIGGTAVRVFRSTIPPGHIWYRQRKDVEDLAREAYYGGLTWLRTTREQYNVTKIDVNGMYANAMLQGVPVGSGCRTSVEMPDRPGIYNCHVYAPSKIRFTFLPLREGKKTTHPHGHFEVALTSNLIVYARRMGYEIEVIDGVFFDHIEYSFGDFVRKCQALEHKYKGEGVGVIAKQLRNTLYGKLGQRPEGIEHIIAKEDDLPPYTWTPKQTLQGVIIDDLYYRETLTERAHMMPHWAAWITASARIMLAETVYAIGPGWCIYGDTDSIVVDNLALDCAIDTGAVRVGTEYGEWKIEREYEIFRTDSPKQYIGAYRKDGTLWLDAVHKGIPDRAVSIVELKALFEGVGDVTVEYDQLRKAIHTTGARPLRDHVRRTIRQKGERLRYDIDPATGEILTILYAQGG